MSRDHPQPFILAYDEPSQNGRDFHLKTPGDHLLYPFGRHYATRERRDAMLDEVRAQRPDLPLVDRRTPA